MLAWLNLCAVREFWQQQGEAGRVRSNLFGEVLHPLP
jgi:hypothetical protein